MVLKSGTVLEADVVVAGIGNFITVPYNISWDTYLVGVCVCVYVSSIDILLNKFLINVANNKLNFLYDKKIKIS